MKEQLWGIAISLMVHGITVILLAGIGQGITATLGTVALGFGIQFGRRRGEDGSKAVGEPAL